MVAQFSLQEELQLIRDPSNYIVTNEIDPADEDAVATALERASLNAPSRFNTCS